ncbi:MAG: hypothetical protein Q9175_000484 [Cornicularia normoerica]
MTSYSKTTASNGSSSENLVTGAIPIEILDIESSDMSDNTILVVWECKNCGYLDIDLEANPDSMPTPMTTECFADMDETLFCQFERLDRFRTIDIKDGRPCATDELKIMNVCMIWNEICESEGCSIRPLHWRSRCEDVDKALAKYGASIEKHAASEANITASKAKISIGVGAVVMVGVLLALLGAILVAASMH